MVIYHAFAQAKLVDEGTAILLPQGGEDGRELRLPVGKILALSWLRPCIEWADPQLLIGASRPREVTIRLLKAGGRAFKVLYFEVAEDGSLQAKDRCPQSFAEWMTDHELWPTLTVAPEHAQASSIRKT